MEVPLYLYTVSKNQAMSLIGLFYRFMETVNNDPASENSDSNLGGKLDRTDEELKLKG